MTRLASALCSLLFAGLCTPVFAQIELPPQTWTQTHASTRGTVLACVEGVWVAPHGEPLRKLELGVDGSWFHAVSDAKGVFLGGSFGLARLPWDGLAGRATVLDSVSFNAFAVDPEAIDDAGVAAERVLAIDSDSHVWSIGRDGAWRRNPIALPGDRNLGGPMLLHGAGGRWVYTTQVATKAANDARSSKPGAYSCYWSDDLATWHAAELPADLVRENQAAHRLVGSSGLWAIYFSGTTLHVSRDGKSWIRANPPPLSATWIKELVAIDGKLLVLEQERGKRGRLHGRSFEGDWSTRELPEGARIEHMFASRKQVYVIGQRGPSEAPKLFPLEEFISEWTPEPLPPCASLRYVPPTGQVVGLRTVDERVVADCLMSSTEATPRPFTLQGPGWREVTEQGNPKLYAAVQASAPATEPQSRACAGDVCANIDADGRIRRSLAGAPEEVVHPGPARRFRALVHGAGQFAALDTEGRLWLSSDAAAWRPATSAALRFTHLAGSDGELIAITALSEVLEWRCPPGVANGTTPDAAAGHQGRIARVSDTRQADLGPLARIDTFWDAGFDGTTFAALIDGALLLSRDGQAFRRREIIDGPLPKRLQLATHAGRWWTIEWRDESTPEVSKVKSTVRWHEPNGAVAGSHPFRNEVHLDSASDGRIVALLGSTFGTGRINAWINWTADNGATWGWTQPGVEVAPIHGYGSRGRNSIGGIAHGNGRWVVAGWSKENGSPRAAIAVSRDLVKWETSLLPDTVAAPHTLRFAQGRFIALSAEAKGNGVDVLVSTDGTNWTTRRLSDMPAARLAIGQQRIYLYSGETVLASDDAAGWREVVTPRIEPRWMAEVEGMLCYAAAEPGSPSSRLRFVRTPAPSNAVHAGARQRFAYEAPSMAAQLAVFQKEIEGLGYDRLVYAAIDKHIADLPPITDAYAKDFVLALFAKRRTPNLIYRLAEVVASPQIRKATKELLTPTEQSTLREYAAAVRVRRGHLVESIKKLPAPPEVNQVPSRIVPLYDLHAAHQRYRGGSAGAAYDLAIAYAQGKGVEKDMDRARTYGEYAVKRLGAQPSMDQLAAAGSITGLLANAVDDHKAGRYGACADKLWTLIDMNAYIAMATAAGLCIFDGSMAVCTVEQAYTWLHWMAVRLGDPEALNSLGVAVSVGIGVPADSNASIQWYELAAARGSKLAVSNLDSARKRKEYFDGLASMFQGNLASNDILNELGDALGGYAGTLTSTLKDSEPATTPKYAPGTMLGGWVDGAFRPELFVHYARADGDYRVLVRSTRTWKDNATTPPTERTLWAWDMSLAGITELDRHQRAQQTWGRCGGCDTQGTKIDGQQGRRPCGDCAGRGFVTPR
jgi:TPR repeat protein